MDHKIGSRAKKAYGECVCCGRCCMDKTVNKTSVTEGEVGDIASSYMRYNIIDKYIDHKRYGGQIGTMKSANDQCIALHGYECILYNTWRPAICKLFPFLPVLIDNSLKVLISTTCKSISGYVGRLNEDKRMMLRDELLFHFETFDKRIIDFICNYTKNYEEKIIL
jgi:hypothetical protein